MKRNRRNHTTGFKAKQGESVKALEGRLEEKSPSPQEIKTLVTLFTEGRYTELETLARRLTARFPQHGFGWKVLGACLKQQGLLEDAIEPMQKAIASRPADAEVHNNLGVVLKDMGRLSDAEDSIRRALELKPDYAEAHKNLGNILMENGRLSEAEASYRRALDLRPDYAEVHSDLGATLNDQGRLSEAEANCRRALQIKPDLAEACFNLGATLGDQGRLDEAETSYRRALEIKPDFAEALVAIGELTADTGQFAEAEALLRRALVIVPQMPEAWSAMARLRKMTTADTGWLTGAEKITQRGLQPRQELPLRYAMGKYFDDVKDFDRAFLNYRRANELKRTFCKEYKRQEHTLAVDLLTRYHRERVRKVLAGASASARPLFIVGMPRSGTSLTEQIIASHPATFGAGELRFWHDAVGRLGGTAMEAEPDDALLRDLAEECLRNLARLSVDAMRVVDKMPVNFMHLGLIHTVFPNARILHTQRNPIDTCLSIYFQDFKTTHPYANDLEDLAHYYREYHRLMAHWRAVLPSEVFLDVPYESLVDDQKGWSRRIIAFIGLDWDERCLDFDKTERNVHTASKWQVRQKIYTTSRERWRNYEKYVGPLLSLLELHG